MDQTDPAWPALSMKRVDVSEDEFGRCFEAGMSAQGNGLPKSSNPYRTDQRWLAWKDGWQAS